MATPAQQLLGMTLDGGWKVVEAIAVLPGKTGGNFSHGYIVQNDRGIRAFLKALDYSRALKPPDPARALQALTEAYNFERRVLERCRDRRLDRVVMAFADGTTRVAGEPVQYLILELAEGDARSQAKASARFDLAWTLRTLHHVAAGRSHRHRTAPSHAWSPEEDGEHEERSEMRNCGGMWRRCWPRARRRTSVNGLGLATICRLAGAAATRGRDLAHERPVVCLAVAALCMLLPTSALAQMEMRMGSSMMGGPPVSRDSRATQAPAPLPDREAREGTPQPPVSTQMTGPMGHEAVREPFYQESTFLVLASLAVGAGGLAGYRVTRTRWRHRRAGAAFVTEAVLVVDLVQSTHLATHYGDGLAMRARTALKDRTLTIAQADGLVFAENTGDGYFMTFESVTGAIRTAFALLEDLRDHPPDLGPAPPLQVRVGITYGEILLDARGVRHGAVINKAFRLEGLSREAFVQIEGHGETAAIPECGRIFLGEEAAEEARAQGFPLAPVGVCTLKGFSGLHRVYQAVP
jgi:class 3 adenylate cyclase